MHEPDPSSTRAWSTPNFRRLWGASTASLLGSEIAEIALPLFALLSLSASAGELGLLRMAQFLPFLLVTLPVGVLVDRLSGHRLSLMIGADVGRFLLILAIPVIYWLGGASMTSLYVCIFLAACLTVVFQIADFSLLPDLVPLGALVDANGKVSATHSASAIGGRGLGGVLVQVLTAPVAVAVNAAGYLVSAVGLSRIKVSPAAPPSAEQERIPPGETGWRSAAAGVRLAFVDSRMRALLCEATTFNAFQFDMFAPVATGTGTRQQGRGPFR